MYCSNIVRTILSKTSLVRRHESGCGDRRGSSGTLTGSILKIGNGMIKITMGKVLHLPEKKNKQQSHNLKGSEGREHAVHFIQLLVSTTGNSSTNKKLLSNINFTHVHALQSTSPQIHSELRRKNKYSVSCYHAVMTDNYKLT